MYFNLVGCPIDFQFGKIFFETAYLDLIGITVYSELELFHLRLKKFLTAYIFEFQGGPFDTILMMGHGIGMVETIDGLDRFLAHTRGILSEDGQVLLDSLDVRPTDDPGNLAYHEANRQEGRYIGEIRLQFEFQSNKGPYCGWLHIDPETLKEHAGKAGWKCEVIMKDNGNYLARLSKKGRK